jgi:hypothetical protein
MSLCSCGLRVSEPVRDGVEKAVGGGARRRFALGGDGISCSPHERSDMREGDADCIHHALVMLQITCDGFISNALSLEPGRFA